MPPLSAAHSGEKRRNLFVIRRLAVFAQKGAGGFRVGHQDTDAACFQGGRNGLALAAAPGRGDDAASLQIHQPQADAPGREAADLPAVFIEPGGADGADAYAENAAEAVDKAKELIAAIRA